MHAILLLVLLQDPEQPEEQPPEPERPIIVVGKREGSDPNDIPSGVTIVTRQQIDRSSASNIREVIERTPGFFSQGGNKGAYDAFIDVRGFNNGGGNGQRTLVMVDGRRTNSPVSSTTDWASIPLDNVERIEIHRGPSAALYGDPALAAVINIVTRRSDSPGVRTKVSADTFGRLQAGAQMSGRAGEMLYDLYTSTDSTDGWRDNSEFDATDFSARLEVPLGPETSGYLKIGAHDDDRERPNTLSLGELALLGRNGSTSVDFGAREELNVDLAVTHVTDSLGEFTLHLTGLQGKSLADFGGFQIDDEFDEVGLYLKNVAEAGEGWTVTTGIDMVHEEARALSGFAAPFTDTDYRRRLLGGYLHIEGQLTPVWVVSGSLRFDRAIFDLDKFVPPSGFGTSFQEQRALDQFSPSIGTTIHVSEVASLFASFGRPFRYPQRDELIGFTVGSPQLDRERSSSYEAGIRVRGTHGGSAEIAFFRMDVENEIFFDASTFTNLNFRRVVHQGVETSFELPLGESGLVAFGSYTYTRAIIRSDGLDGSRFPVTPAHVAQLGVAGSWDGLSTTITGRLTGRRHLINDVTNSAPTLGSYWLIDTKVGYAWESVSVSVTVFNLFDREYMESGGLNFLGMAGFNPGPERSVLVGVETEF